MVLATPLALNARFTAWPVASQAAAALFALFSARPPTRTGRVPLAGLVVAQVNFRLLLTLANAGTQTAALSALRTALRVTVCSTSETWFATSNSRPLSAAVWVHEGLPNVQVAAFVVAGAAAVMPSSTLPAVVCCIATLTDELPAGMLKAAPPGQFTVMPVPLAVSVPATPPV